MEHSHAERRESFSHGHDGEVEYRQIVASGVSACLVAPWK